MLESSYKKPYITPPGEHPRLMLRARDLPRIRENLTLRENAEAVLIYEYLCSYPVSGLGATPEYSTYNLAEVLAAEALAFRALLSGKKTDAEAAIETINFLLDRFEVRRGNMAARWAGHLIFVAAEVYDWCYSFISKELKEKMIADCERIAALYFEMKYPPVKQTAISGHGTEAQLLRDLLAFSVAVYDERPDIYIFCAGRILDEYVPQVRAYLAGGAHCQGPSYGSYRWVSLAWAELIFYTMSGQNVFGCLESTSDWFIYMTRPDGEAVRLGDDFNETKAEYNRRAPFTVPFFFAYVLTGREEFYSLFSSGMYPEFLLPVHRGMDYYREGSWGEGLLSPVSILIFDRLSGKKDAPRLEACRYFGSPVGQTVFRADDTHVMLKIGELWGANHDHLDTGCFQLFYGAPLLTDSGVYDSYHSPHRQNYLIRTSAHNCITVELLDNSDNSDTKNRGGTRLPAGGKEPKNIEDFWSDEYRMAYVISHSESEDGCEIVGDLTPAYRHTCKRVIRTMAYNHKERTLTVKDEITALLPQNKKTFHLHCQTEPEIKGNTIIIKNKVYVATCRVILPADAKINAVGGEGRQFEVDGKNYPPEPPYTAEEGWGDIRISPAAQNLTDVFLIEIKATKEHSLKRLP
jgi:hypothetical protein